MRAAGSSEAVSSSGRGKSLIQKNIGQGSTQNKSGTGYELQSWGPELKFGVFTAFLGLLILPIAPAAAQTDWPMYGHDYASTRYSPLNQINTQNVQHLQRDLDLSPEKRRSASAVGRGGGPGRRTAIFSSHADCGE